MKITIEKLTLTNFKGIRSLSISFEHITNILGINGTGKSTLMDAFLWLLFGKDSSDRKDFEIKTLDGNNVPYHHLAHEVEGVLTVDGEVITLRRTYKEKWTKKKGAAEAEFTGHETLYFWNDVPLKQEEYQQKIASLLNEGIFKLITNTTYFNSLKWQDRRAMLMQIAGVIDDNEILTGLNISSNHKASLEAAMKQGKNRENFKDFKAELSAKKKKIKDELILLPSRIDEANRSLTEDTDFSAVEAIASQIRLDIENVEGLLMNKTKAQKEYQDHIGDLLQKKQNINRMLMDAEFGLKNQVQAKKNERETAVLVNKSILNTLNEKLSITRRDYSTASARKEQLLKEQTDLKDKWYKVNAEKLEFKEGQFCCPTCKREYEASDIEAKKAELTANFNTDKSKRLEDITHRGKAIGLEISDLEVKMSNLKADGEKLNLDITSQANRITDQETENLRLSGDDEAELEKAIAANENYQKQKAEVEALTIEISKPYTSEDNSALLQRKKELTAQLDELKIQLSTKGQREKQLQRIEELKGQESTMAQELASLEGIEFSIDQFTKVKMDTLEKRINSRFKIVQFKMFEDQVNGGQVEACTTLINGVPYPDANTASKINAGLDIIQVFNEHYDSTAPIFIDNRESVIDIPDMDAQIINLIVSAAHKKLTVGQGKQQLEMA